MAIDFTKCEQCGNDIEEGAWFCSQACYEVHQAIEEDRENDQRDEEQERLDAEFVILNNAIIARRKSGVSCA